MPAVYLAKNLTYHQLNLSTSTLLHFSTSTFNEALNFTVICNFISLTFVWLCACIECIVYVRAEKVGSEAFK